MTISNLAEHQSSDIIKLLEEQLAAAKQGSFAGFAVLYKLRGGGNRYAWAFAGTLKRNPFDAIGELLKYLIQKGNCAGECEYQPEAL